MNRMITCLLAAPLIAFSFSPNAYAYRSDSGRRSSTSYQDTRRAVVKAEGQIKKFCTETGSGFKEFFTQAADTDTYEDIYERAVESFVPKVHNTLSPIFEGSYIPGHGKKAPASAVP